MKRIILAAIFVCTATAHADISLGGQEAAEAQPAAQEYVALAHEVLQSMKELTASLKGISDPASADAAAPQVTRQITRLLNAQKKAESMPKAGTQVELQVKNSMNMLEVQQLAKDFLNAMIQIGMNSGYGSQALLDALSPITGQAQSADGMQP